MEFIVLGFFTALGKLLLLCKLIGIGRVVRLEKWLDALFTLVVPIFFIGTFSGALLAVFSGLWFTVLLRLIALFVKPKPLIQWPAKTRR